MSQAQEQPAITTASPAPQVQTPTEGMTNTAASDVAQNESITVDNSAGTSITTESPAGVVDIPLSSDMARGKNNLKPESTAEGEHTTFKTNASGQVTGHAEWAPNAQNPTGFDQVKRVDTQHAEPTSHVNKVTGEDVPTPHVHDPETPGGVRPARPDELPK